MGTLFGVGVGLLIAVCYAGYDLHKDYAASNKLFWE
jgi:hypothetical protein